MEGNPLERRDTGVEHHIPGLPQIDTYEQKIAKLRNLEALIKADEELEKKIKVDQEKGLPLPLAEKMLKDTIGRLAENKKELDKLMGRTVQ